MYCIIIRSDLQTIKIWRLVNKQCKEYARPFYQKRVNWDAICCIYQLNDQFIREHYDMVNWKILSHCQQLSEDIMHEFKDQVDWCKISLWQKMSEDFICKHKDLGNSLYNFIFFFLIPLVNWFHISRYKSLSAAFIREHGSFNTK